MVFKNIFMSALILITLQKNYEPSTKPYRFLNNLRYYDPHFSHKYNNDLRLLAAAIVRHKICISLTRARQ